MTAGRLVRSAEAEEDLVRIWLRIAGDNPPAADRLLSRIDEVCGLLAEQPKIGAAYDEVRPGLRLFAVRSYLVLYREIPGGAEIVRVLHSAMEWRKLL